MIGWQIAGNVDAVKGIDDSSLFRARLQKRNLNVLHHNQSNINIGSQIFKLRFEWNFPAQLRHQQDLQRLSHFETSIKSKNFPSQSQTDGIGSITDFTSTDLDYQNRRKRTPHILGRQWLFMWSATSHRYQHNQQGSYSIVGIDETEYEIDVCFYQFLSSIPDIDLVQLVLTVDE